MGKPLITSETVLQATIEGAKFISATSDTIVTPLARDMAKEKGIRIQRTLANVSPDDPIQEPTPIVVPTTGMFAAPAANSTSVVGNQQASSLQTNSNQPVPDDQLESAIRQIVSAVLTGNTPQPATQTDACTPVKHVDARSVTMEDFPFEGPPPGMRVQVGDVVTTDDNAPIAAGYMTLSQGEFPWTLTYDEVQIVLEGELHITTPQGVKIGKPGDILYVPKGSNITFGTPNWTKFIYVTYPANWAG